MTDVRGTSSSSTGYGTLTFDDVLPGIPRCNVATDSLCGKKRCCRGLTMREVMFLGFSFSSLLVLVVITCIKLKKGQEGADFTFSIVLLVNCCMCLIYVMIGVLFERPYELGVFVVSMFALWLYILLNYFISLKGTLKLWRLVLFWVFSWVTIVLGVSLIYSYHGSKNLIQRTVGANAKTQDMCNTLFIFFGLLSLDLQLSLSLAILLLSSGFRHLSPEDKILLPVSLVIAIAVSLFGYFAMRLENKIMTIVYVALSISVPAYAIYLMVEASNDIHDANHDPPMEIAIYAVLFVTGSGCLVMCFALLYFGVKVYRNFGKGLRQSVFGAAIPASTVTATQNLDHHPIIEDAENVATS